MPTILQISDPHLLSQADGTLKAVPTAQSLELVLRRAREEVADPAWVVLSGDLSHEHTVAGYELLKKLLGDWTERSLLIPGNHDDRAAMRSVFEQVPGIEDDDVWFREEAGEWQLIGLDSHVPDQVPGELSDETLDRLEGILSEDPLRPSLIFLHHPPASVNSAWMDTIGLQNPQPLEALVRGSAGVRAIFCGHVHHVFEGTFAGVPFMSAPAVSFQFVPASEDLEFDLIPPGFRVIELTGAEFSTRVVRLDEVPFVPQKD